MELKSMLFTLTMLVGGLALIIISRDSQKKIEGLCKNRTVYTALNILLLLGTMLFVLSLTQFGCIMTCDCKSGMPRFGMITIAIMIIILAANITLLVAMGSEGCDEKSVKTISWISIVLSILSIFGIAGTQLRKFRAATDIE